MTNLECEMSAAKVQNVNLPLWTLSLLAVGVLTPMGVWYGKYGIIL